MINPPLGRSFPEKRSVFSRIGWVIHQNDSFKSNNPILGELAPKDLTDPPVRKAYILSGDTDIVSEEHER
jgi:hypothetical protein